MKFKDVIVESITLIVQKYEKKKQILFNEE